MTILTTPSSAAATSLVGDPARENLCFLQYEGYHLKHKAAYRELVNQPQALCERCGRTARNQRNLCEPTDLV